MMKGNDDWWVVNAGCRGTADGEWVMKDRAWHTRCKDRQRHLSLQRGQGILYRMLLFFVNATISLMYPKAIPTTVSAAP